MDELEQRLRSALTELANEVPPSSNAWAEHERRVAHRTKRARMRPALMAVAAAAAVALIAVPVLLINTRGTDKELDVATSPTETSPSSRLSPTASLPDRYGATYDPAPGEQVLIEPRTLMGEQAGKEARNLYAFAIRKNDQNLMCVGEGPSFTTVPPSPQTKVKLRNCIGLNPPKPGKVVWLKYNLPTQGSSGAWLFVASNNTDRILLRRAEGNIVVASKIGSTTEFSMFFTVLGSAKPLAAYTAKDPANVSLEDG